MRAATKNPASTVREIPMPRAVFASEGGSTKLEVRPSGASMAGIEHRSNDIVLQADDCYGKSQVGSREKIMRRRAVDQDITASLA
jgi:hypothetical protein